MVARGGFEYRGDHVVCPQGKVLNRAGYHRRNASYHTWPPEGLPGLSGKGRVSSSSPEAPVPGTQHLLPAAP